MSGEYISREAAIKSTWMILEGMGYPRSENRSLERTVEAVFKSAPAADVVEVRHGRWMWDGGEDMHCYCSRCHHNAYGCTTEILDGKYRYCPSCGAVMDGGHNDV